MKTENTIEKMRTSEKGKLGNLIQTLIKIALHGLKNTLTENDQLFCYRRRWDSDGLKNEGTSIRYTIISLLGIRKFESLGVTLPFNYDKIYRYLSDLLFYHPDKKDNIGDKGLMLWLSALNSPDHVTHIISKLKTSEVFDNIERNSYITTTELAWILTGLAYCADFFNDTAGWLREVSGRIYKLLIKNCGKNGIFGHMDKKSIKGRLRGHIGSFADQIYSIYALCHYVRVYHDDEALIKAVKCADTLKLAQGPLGQWWWHYNSVSGKVNGRYPVYSVHQDGMAPMALYMVGQLSGNDMNDCVNKGLRWLTGNNEINFNVVDDNLNMVWRGFYAGKYRAYVEEISSSFGIKLGRKDYPPVYIKYECRPYHFGWILYALSHHLNKAQAEYLTRMIRV